MCCKILTKLQHFNIKINRKLNFRLSELQLQFMSSYSQIMERLSLKIQNKVQNLKFIHNKGILFCYSPYSVAFQVVVDTSHVVLSTALKIKFSAKDLFSKCEQISRTLWIVHTY